MTERNCSTCVHHIQAGGIDKTPASCWSCLSSWTVTGVDLPGWHPEDKDTVKKPLYTVAPPTQSHAESLLEATLNTLSGFLLSYLVWILIATPLFNIPVNYTESFWITVLFTGVSLARSYVWRRLFVNNFWRKA